MPRQKNAHGQYFTPPAVAELMVSLVRSPKDAAVLEPSAGEGVFLDALDDAGFTDLTGVEVDHELVARSARPLHGGSFVSWRPPRSYQAVVGNPPYIRWRDLCEDSKREVEAHPLFGTLFNSLSDYLTVFIALSVEALAPGGELVFVTPSFWLHTQHSAPLREWLLVRGAVTDIVDFGEAAVFPGVASAIVVFRFVKGAPADDISYFEYLGPRKLPTAGLELADRALFSAKRIPSFSTGCHWSLATQDEQAPAIELERACTTAGAVSRLGDFVDIANGMVSGLDAVFRIGDDLAATLTPAELAATLPVLKAFQMMPYYSGDTCRYINLPEGLTEADARARYPHLLAHLAAHKDVLGRRYSNRKDLGYWDWSFKRSASFFLNGQPKGFVPSKERLTCRAKARFTLADAGVASTQDVTAFAPKEGVRESLAYIVGYLNQLAVTDWVRLRGLMKGGVAEFSERPLGSTPFRAIDWDNAGEVARHDRVVSYVAEYRTATTARRAKLEALLAGEFTTLLGSHAS
jgi:adenine-specific DNA-methyltransferase